ncbi:DUF1353 domain-containing protein [Persicitalea jodogahamensis]|uniref:DUF1353 domain-containing protein n=1 Tax=Persicitalea jodogahamensis TaxID=402147 RepID=A0A8J3G892_9BACT|nr:DUF1353 domain-containing protein [Persicitalea jodogahamensis]GHB63964.1 hypothetical protein GCM10007390_17290 [Persicitalea jodogahamensis]
MTQWPDINIRKTRPGEGNPRKTDQFITTEDFEYHHPLVGKRVVPAGFVTDGLSVPQLFWAIIPPHGIGFAAAVVHDDCYVNQVGVMPNGTFFYEARRIADYMFYEYLLLLGMPLWEAQLAFFMVSKFGAKAFRRYRKPVDVWALID